MIPAPPRLPQLLLSALGARLELRDALLGDMAEEYYMRAEMQGSHAARAWYVDEAYRAVPHLIRDSVRNLGIRGIAHIIGAALKAYASIVVIAVMLLPLIKLFPPSTQPSPVTSIVIGLPVCIFGGYLAARLGRRAPLLSSAALGVFWAMAYGVALLVVLERMPWLAVPAWCNFVEPPLVITGTLVGGICQIARPRVL